MKLSCVSTIVCLLLLLGGTAQAVMVDFEPTLYTAGSAVAGTDGWGSLGSPNVVTAASGEVLAGTQSAKLGGSGLSALARVFDSPPNEFGSGSILSTHMMLVSGNAGSSVEMFYSQVPLTFGATPGGVMGYSGGNFTLFGAYGTNNEIDTGYAFQQGVDYLVEMVFDIENNNFDAYVTPAGGAQTFLGTQGFQGFTVTPSAYPTSGVILITRLTAVGVFDNVDMYVVDPEPPAPLLAEPVDFENEVYVAGNTVVGVDGWKALTKYAPNSVGVVTDANVIDGTKSLQVSGAADTSILYRHLGAGTSFDDGYIISSKMMIVDGEEGGTGEFYFSNNITGELTPCGIIGVVDGNFLIFGKQEGVAPYTIDTGIAFLTDNEYLLEMQLDLTDQTFKSYLTDLTGGGERTLLGEAGFWVEDPVEAGDDSNAGYVVYASGGAEVVFDDFNCEVPEPATLTALIGLIAGAFVLACRRKVA